MSKRLGAEWLQVLGRRSARLFWLKLVGITAFMWLFFEGYFHVLRHPVAAVTEMPLTAVDRWLPLQPLAIWPYVSLWFYVGIAPGLLTSFRDLVIYGVWAAGLCLAGLGFFYLWPTAVPYGPADVPGSSLFSVLQGVDAAGNACPSLHVASAVYSGLWLDRLLLLIRTPWVVRAVSAGWALLIVYSTLAVKQHVFWDVLAGAGFGIAFAWAAQRWSGLVRGHRFG